MTGMLFSFSCSYFLLFACCHSKSQAIIAYSVMKLTVAFASLLLVYGGILRLTTHAADSWPMFFLGLIWLPSLEFIPKITLYQKYLTIARFLLSIPCLILGNQPGWYWS
jgi:hypothetical protein